MKNVFAVVTGTSQGLGRSFAWELARSKRNIVLISLPDEGLPELCVDIKNRFGVIAMYYETDLSNKDNVLRIANWINENFEIDFLTNNAGIGGTKKSEDAPTLYIEKTIQLNVLATSLLTHKLLPNLKRQERAYILNVKVGSFHSDRLQNCLSGI